MTVRGPCAPAVVAAGMLVACTGGATEPRQLVDAPASWWRQLASEPGSFDALMAGGRDGWVAMHDNHHRDAFRHFASASPVAATRAALAEARLHGDLARLVAHANRARHEALSARGVEAGDLGDAFAAWGARCSPGAELEGLHGELAGWMSAHPMSPQRSYAFALAQEGEPADPPPMPAGTPEPLKARLALHRRVIEGHADALEALTEAAQQPVTSESADGFERHHVDPCVDAVLAGAWSLRAHRTLDKATTLAAWQEVLQQAGLSGSLFAPWAHVDDLRLGEPERPLWGTESAEVWATPAGVDVAFDGDVQGVREAVSAWTQWTDAEATAAREAATPEGAALLDGLDPVGAYRQDVLVAAAREALRKERPHQALALLEPALDVTERDVGAANSPELFVLLAEARLKTGRTRQALDALEPLTARVPTVASAKELVGDLAVLQSLDRVGDSKEN